MADDPTSVKDILHRIGGLADTEDRVSIGAAIEAFGNRSYGPFLVVLPLIEMSPIGGIPGLPTTLAAVIVLVAMQMLWGRETLWLPDFVASRSVTATTARKAVARSRGLARLADRWFHGRLPRLTEGPFVKIAAVAVIVLAAAVPPLELLPFASTAPMLAIFGFGLALLVRDGALMLVASTLALAAVGIGVGLAGAS